MNNEQRQILKGREHNVRTRKREKNLKNKNYLYREGSRPHIPIPPGLFKKKGLR
jgi:hypothetical protein